MKAPFFPRCIAFFVALFLSAHAPAQYSGYSGYTGYTGYSGYSGSSMTTYPTGPLSTLYASGYIRIQVPIERVGHNFMLKWRTTNGGPVTTASAYGVGFITNAPVVNQNENSANLQSLQSFLVVASPPYSTYTYTPYTYTYNGSTYTSYTYTSVPFSAYEWWLSDLTAGEDSVVVSGTPGGYSTTNISYSGVLNTWTQASTTVNRSFAIPASRYGHGLVAGSAANGWTTVTTMVAPISTYSNGTSGSLVPLNWFTGSAPASPGDFYLADRNDGMRALVNQTRTVNAPWVHDYNVYPLSNVQVYLPPEETRNLYVLHYQIPGQVPAAVTVRPTKLESVLSTPTVNAGQQNIPAGSACVSGLVANGANFWLTRNIDARTTSPQFALPTTLANSTSPKIWLLSSVSLPPANIPWQPVTFGIASGRSAQSFTVTQTSSFSPTEPGVGSRQILRYEDYATDHTPNHFDYFNITALVNPAEPINLVAHTTGGTETFSQGKVWVLDGWSALGGQPGTPPASTPGQYNFSITVAGPEPEDNLALISPDFGYYTLNPDPSATTLTFQDHWHPLQTWTTTERRWTLSLPYSGSAGSWRLENPTSSQAWNIPLNVHNVSNFTRNIGFQSRVTPLVFYVSLSRWNAGTAPRLRLRQPNGADFPVMARNSVEYASLASNADVYSNPAYYFLADTVAQDGLVFWLYDEETGEESPMNTDLVTWFALPKPEWLRGSINVQTGTAELHWPKGSSAPEGGFDIERQLTGESTWQTIGVAAVSEADATDTLRFSDPNLVVGKVHSYRVRYTYGSGAAKRRSARSDLVILTGWRDTDLDRIPDDRERENGTDPSNSDTDGDGTADGDEADQGTNPNNADTDGDGVSDGDETEHGTDPKDSDSDNDGLSDGEEIAIGTDPLESDSDGDDVLDGTDAYPLDDRRQKEMRVLRYVPIDVSTSSSAGQSDIKGVAIDSGGNIGFAWEEPASDEYKTAVWSPATGAVLKLTIPRKSPVRTATFQIDDDNPDDETPPQSYHVNYRTHYGLHSVNAAGLLAVWIGESSALWTDRNDVGVNDPLPYPDAPHGGHPYGGYPAPRASSGMGMMTGFNNPWFAITGESCLRGIRDERAGAIHGFYPLGISNGGALWGFNGDYEFHTYYDGVRFGVNITPPGFSIVAINSTGGACGQREALIVRPEEQGGNYTRVEFVGYNGGFFNIFGGEDMETTALGINDSSEIYGFSPRFQNHYSLHPDPAAAHPFLFSAGEATDIYYFLPEEYRNHISVRETDRTQVVFNANGDMIFSAHIADGPSDNPTWRPAQLLLDRNNNQLHEVTGAPSYGSVMSNAGVLCGLEERPVIQGGVPVPDPDREGHILKTHRAFAYVPMEVGYFTRNWLDGAFEEQSHFLYESDPTPAIDLSVVSSTIDPASDSLTVVTDCRVRDPLSESLADQEYRVKAVRFLVNGAEVETVNLNGEATGDAVEVWAPHPSERTIRKTFVIPNVSVGAQTISAITGVNKAWRQGTAQVGIVVDQQRDAEGLPIGPDGTPHLGVVAEKRTTHSAEGFFDPYVVRVRAPQGASALLIGANAPKLKLNGEAYHLVESPNLVTGDPLPAGFQDYFLAAGVSPTGSTEKPKLFVIVEENADDPIPSDIQTYELTMGTDGDAVTIDQRSLVRIPAAMRMLASSVAISNSSNSNQASAPPPPVFTTNGFAPPPAQNQSAPPPPPGPRYNESQLKFAFECVYGEPGAAILAEYQKASRGCQILVLPLTNVWLWRGWETPLNSAGENHQGINFVIDDDKFANAFEAAAALWAAMHSVRGENSVSNVALSIQWQQYENQTGEIGNLYRAFRAAQLSEFADRLNDLTVAAKMGLCVLPYGGGIVANLVIGSSDALDSWRDGNTSAAAFQSVFAVLPMMAGPLSKRNLPFVIRTSRGEVVLSTGVTGEMTILAEAVRAASKQAQINSTEWRVSLMRELRPFIEGTAPNAQRLSAETMDALIDLGSFGRSPYPRTRLWPNFDTRPYDTLGAGILERKGLTGDWYALSNRKPYKNLKRHHDLPLRFEKEFLRAGLDPNDGYYFGRLVGKKLHDDVWHGGKGFGPGGPYDKVWDDFFRGIERPTAKQITDYLEILKKPIHQTPGGVGTPVNTIDESTTIYLDFSGWD